MFAKDSNLCHTYYYFKQKIYNGDIDIIREAHIKYNILKKCVKNNKLF